MTTTTTPKPVKMARWLLLAAVIAGILAMHILSAADSGDSHQPMAMTPAGVAAQPAASPGTDPSMVMDMPAARSEAPAAGPVTATQAKGGGVGISPMSCCVLFLVAAAGLVLLIRSASASAAQVAGNGGGPAAASTLQRGPPGPGLPRIALSVLRV